MAADDDREASSLDNWDTGWAELLTVDSSVKDITATGGDRVNIQTADERSLTGVRGITSDIARAIVAYRGQNQFKTVADLLEVTAVAESKSVGQRSGGNCSRPGPVSAASVMRNRRIARLLHPRGLKS